MPSEYNIQLSEAESGKLATDGGNYYVVTAGTPTRITIYDNADAVKNNPGTISSGNIFFRTAESVTSVDIYGLTDKGYAFYIKGAKPGAISNWPITRGQLDQTIVIPFNIAAAPAAVVPALTAAVEFNSGFYLNSLTAVKPVGIGILVTTLDATETIDVGVNSTSGNDDPNGWIEAASLAAVGFVRAEVGYVVGTNSVYVDLTGGTAEWTLGALLSPANVRHAKAEGTDSATTKNGIPLISEHIAGLSTDAAKKEEITFTLSTGTDTAAGFIVIPTRINQLTF